MRGGLVVLYMVVVLLGFAAPAGADEQTATQGAVSATLSFSFQEDPFGYSDLWLTISRGGQVLFDDAPSDEGCSEECWPGGGQQRDSVRVRDLDGDGEPEVLVDLYSGGAHCCFIARIHSFDGSGYREIGRNFADPGYRLGDIDDDGVPELVSSDARFAYRFTSFASSLFPIRIWSYYSGTLYNVTDEYPGRIRADAARSWRYYRKALRHDEYEPRGAVAAWAADQYRLGKRTSTLRTLRKLARRGQLPGFPVRRQLRFITELDGFLRRLGYGYRRRGHVVPGRD